MSLSLHTIAPKKGSRAKKFRIGRGYATGRGTTAGRGTKGQRARTGGRKRLKLKGLKQMLLGFPKSRGFKSMYPTVYAVPVGRVAAVFTASDRIDLDALKAKRLIPKSAVLAKMIGGGEIDKKLTFVGIMSTASVKEAVEKAGGSFEKANVDYKKKDEKTKGGKAKTKGKKA
ncbi:MAG: 50S ribosomal protein L15 [Patescibacteria group bacterium]|jgi:large subunit ribosomal protein L15